MSTSVDKNSKPNTFTFNMATCSVIFWSIVVPIAMYGCELLMLSDKSIAIQEHMGKRIQRFQQVCP